MPASDHPIIFPKIRYWRPRTPYCNDNRNGKAIKLPKRTWESQLKPPRRVRLFFNSEKKTKYFNKSSVFLRSKKRVKKHKYYQHDLEGESRTLILKASGKQDQILTQKVVIAAGAAIVLGLFGAVSYKSLLRKKI